MARILLNYKGASVSNRLGPFSMQLFFKFCLYARILQLLNGPEVLGWWLVGYIYRAMPEAELVTGGSGVNPGISCPLTKVFNGHMYSQCIISF
jgi:hypothetical protein